MIFKYLFLILFSFSISTGFAEPTKIIVRAKAKDAKFIGSSIGGAYVIIRNSLTNEILAQGTTSGSTGNTELIMKTPHERGKRLTDGQTAKFEAMLNIDEPTHVTIEVTAPVNIPGAKATATTQIWLIPGKHIEGDGIVVEIPGFVVEILNPQTHQSIPYTSAEAEPVTLKVNMVMMCGCTISKGGMWDADKYEVQAEVKLNGKKIESIPLEPGNQPNIFEAALPIQAPGNYEVLVHAYDPATGNTGVDELNFIISE